MARASVNGTHSHVHHAVTEREEFVAASRESVRVERGGQGRESALGLQESRRNTFVNRRSERTGAMPLLRQFRRLQGLIATEICFIAAVFLLGRASAQNCQPGFGLADSIGPGCQQLVTPKIDFNGKITNQQMPIPEYVAVVGQDFVLNLGVEGANVLGLATQVERADDWLPDFSAMTTGTTMAVLTMMPKEPQAGTQYTACAKAMPTAPVCLHFRWLPCLPWCRRSR